MVATRAVAKVTDELTIERRDHVLRPPLPWRPSATTECGRAAADVAAVITRDQLSARIKTLGKQRTAFTVCMTCATTAGRWSTFEENPVDCLRREVYGGRTEDGFADELRALAALVQAHRDEFDGFLSDLGKTTSLADARRKARLKQLRSR